MLQDKELEIRRMFLEEATENLNKIEASILGITDSFDKQQIEDVLRAAHSIKGGAAMMGFETLSNLAHRVEDFFKPFKTQQQYPVKAELLGLLLAIVEQMRACVALNLKGEVVGEQWLSHVNPFFENLHKVGSIPQSHEDSTATLPLEGNSDVVVMLFETEVKECLDHLSDALANPEHYNLVDEFKIVLSTLSGLGEMLQMPAFRQLCDSITQNLENNHERVKEIAPIALSLLMRSQAAVLVGEVDTIPTQIDLGDLANSPDSVENTIELNLLEQQLTGNFGTLKLPGESSQPCLSAEHNGHDQIWSFESAYSTPSGVNPELTSSLAHDNSSLGGVYLSIEQLNQLNKCLQNAKLNLSQFENLFKIINQQQNSHKPFAAPVQIELDEVPLHFSDEIESQTRFIPKNFARMGQPSVRDSASPIMSAQSIRVDSPKIRGQNTILVVDDSRSVRESLKSLLLEVGYQVELAEDGKIGIDKLQNKLEVSAVICDLDMPRVTGFDFLNRVKSDESFKHLPVAMLTSHTEDSYRETAILLGASAYFTKPYEQQELLGTLKELIWSSSAI